MILAVQRLVHDAIVRFVERQYALPDVPAFAVEVPPNRALGDLAVTVAFQLARPLRKAPRVIADEIEIRQIFDLEKQGVVFFTSFFYPVQSLLSIFDRRGPVCEKGGGNGLGI